MRISINDRSSEIEPGTSIDQVLQRELGGCPSGVAVAVNDEVVPRTRWADSRLREADRLLIVQAVQGG